MLGDSHSIVFGAEWRQQHLSNGNVVINEALLRKLMRGQAVRGGYQYWLQFSDALALSRRCGEGCTDVSFTREERRADKFMLGADWYSQLVRAQMPWQVLVVLSLGVEDGSDDDDGPIQRPMLACLFSMA